MSLEDEMAKDYQFQRWLHDPVAGSPDAPADEVPPQYWPWLYHAWCTSMDTYGQRPGESEPPLQAPAKIQKPRPLLVETDVQALIGYVQHKGSCVYLDAVSCTCGLQALLSLLERRGPEKKEEGASGDDSGAPPAPTGSTAAGNENAAND